MKKLKPHVKDRDINWLYFNERVLLEATDANTPILERLKFLAIFSSNLDEYFKVRISRLRRLKKVDKQLRKKLVLKPNKKLKFILNKVHEQQEHFGLVLGAIKEALTEKGIHLKTSEQLHIEQLSRVTEFFKEHIEEHCNSFPLKNASDLEDGALYLVTRPYANKEVWVIPIPTHVCDRFVGIPEHPGTYLFLDDVVKLHLPSLLGTKDAVASYAIKVSKDAELYLEDESGDSELVEKIYESLGKRASGQPTRLLYDQEMPLTLLEELTSILELGKADLIAGGRFHKLSDFFGFPNATEDASLVYGLQPPLPHPNFDPELSVFDVISQKDQLVHFPYQSFDTVERFLEAAALDAKVVHLKMSLYRIAKTSKLSDVILKALDLGKKVTLFVEAQARFDERNNIEWGRIFKERGATVIFSVPNIKVHSKIAMVYREETDGLCRYAYIGTGNFNAKTAKLYCDHGLFTANTEVTADLHQVFEVLERKLIIPKLKHLLVSPFTTRNRFLDLIQNEIRWAKAGKVAKITAKMNSLEDTGMIEALYAAAEAGVEVRLLVRGFCCLLQKPEEERLADERPIYITSIVDRYLEHGRIYLFENSGEEVMYIGSADWMTRNLDKRIEVLVPILDAAVFKELKDILNIQLADNVKARILDASDSNAKVSMPKDAVPVRSQYAIYEYLKSKSNEKG